jgi:predicted DNA-binding transcriptional regulator YafY
VVVLSGIWEEIVGRNKSAADTLLRQWHMLRTVPRHPRRIGVSEIKQLLDAAAFEISARTIQRDLIELSELFPLTSDEREHPYGWSWQANAAVFDLPNLSNQEALAFAMIEHYLRPLLPHALVDQLQPYFTAAEKRLAAETPKRGSASWLRKIAVVQPTQALIPPRVDATVQAAMTDSLLRDQCVRIQYRRKGERHARDYVLNPLGLVVRGPLTYVVGSIAKYDDVRTFALHRVERAEMLDDVARHPKNFSLDAYLGTGALHFGAGERIRLDAIFAASAAEHLYEAPLAEDRKLTATGEDRVRLRATVMDTSQLRWWLLAFGDNVEIKEPIGLRREFAKVATAMAAAYAE